MWKIWYQPGVFLRGLKFSGKKIRGLKSISKFDQFFFQNQRIGESECANHNGTTENFKWNKACQIYMGKNKGSLNLLRKNKGSQNVGLFWEKHSGRVFPITNDRPLIHIPCSSFRKRKFEKDLLGEGFFIKYQDIENNCINGQNGRAGGSISSRVAVITTGLMVRQ